MENKHPKISLTKIKEKVNGNVCPAHNLPATVTMIALTGKITIKACCKEFKKTIQGLCEQAKIEYYKDQHKSLRR